MKGWAVGHHQFQSNYLTAQRTANHTKSLTTTGETGTFPSGKPLSSFHRIVARASIEPLRNSFHPLPTKPAHTGQHRCRNVI